MNMRTLEGNWNEIKGAAREQWGKLTDDDLDVINGKYDRLVGQVQEKYSMSEEQAKQVVDAWLVKTILRR